MKNSSNIKLQVKWKDFKEVYSEEMIASKKMPIYFDFYDYTKDFSNVYEPAEDTFLMIDCLQLEKNIILDLISKSFGSDKLINTTEIGCGSGLVSSTFVSMLKENLNLQEKINHYCSDINKDCLNLTENLFKNYKLDSKVNFVESNLFEFFSINEIKLDIIFFNPPYVTTDKEELDSAKVKKDISASWAGGMTGSESVIHSRSIVYLLLSQENEYGNIIAMMCEKYDLKYECLLKRKAKNENLAVFKFYF